MYNPNPHSHDNFVIQIRGGDHKSSTRSTTSARTSPPKINFSSMKMFDKFRRIMMNLMFSFPSSSRGSRSQKTTSVGCSNTQRRRSCDYSGVSDPPKTSCSSYYSSNTHYNEAIADCIEFFNKSSSQDGMMFDGRKSDVMV